MKFNGLDVNLGNLYRVSDAETRAITAENPTGGKGKGGMCELKDGVCAYNAQDLGKGWKVNPYMILPSESVVAIADIEGPGCIQHIWMTPTGDWRSLILRVYWDGQDNPAIECPVGDFFACGYGQYAQISSLAVCVNPGSALNCYWQMPFRKHCLMTIENRERQESTFFYQIDYCLTEIEIDAAYFHAQFRRVNPLPYKSVYTVLDGVSAQGTYVGTYMCWGVNNSGWWGEGEFKFFLDGDDEYPTICGTGTEDYFCGSYNFERIGYIRRSVNIEKTKMREYVPFSTPYSGLCQVLLPDGCYATQTRFGMYRWHIADPIRFKKDIRVTCQALGWRSDKRYLPLQDDISSVAFWYQTGKTGIFPELGSKDYLEIV